MRVRKCVRSIVAVAWALLLTAPASASSTSYKAIGANTAPKGVCDPIGIQASVDQATTVQLHCVTIPGVRLTYEIVSGPRHGSASLTAATGQVIYTPAPGYSGPDSFSYSAEHLGDAVATVSIGVGRSPAPAGLALANVAQSRTTWREGNRSAVIARRRSPVGTTFSFTLNQAAAVKFEFTQQVAGHRSNGRCVRGASPKNGRRAACRRGVIRGALAFTGHIGTNKVVFQGRLPRGRKLPLGSYTLQISATNAARQRASARPLRFTIVS